MAAKFPNDITSPWINIDIKLWEPLLKEEDLKLIPKKSYFFNQEERCQYIYIIKSGRVRLASVQENGNEKHILIAEKGSIIGETGNILGCSNSISAMAIVDCYAYMLPAEETLNYIYTHPDLARSFTEYLSRTNMALLNQIIELSFQQASQRVAQVLVYLSDRYGKDIDGEKVIKLKFTHQEIASMINSSRVTVNNIFLSLSELGILQKNDRYFSIKHLDVLKQVASGALEL